MERDRRGVGEKVEPLLEIHRPVVASAPRADGKDADELVVIGERHGGRADERRAGALGIARKEHGPLAGPRDTRRLVEERADDRVPRVLEGDGTPHFVSHVGAPTHRDLRGLRSRVRIPELRCIRLQQRDRLLAERLFDAVDVERRRKRAADFAQPVEEAVRVPFLLKEAGRRDRQRHLDAERLERTQHVGRKSLAARARHGAQDACGSAAVREGHGEKTHGSRELRDGRPGRQEGSAVRIRSDVGEQEVRSFRREVPEKGVRDLHGGGAPSPLDVRGLRARQLAGRDEPERADVEVELRAKLVDRARRDRGDVGQARQGRVEAAHERIALAVPALGIEEPCLVQGACRELRELLREPQLLRREGESSAARHREKAEHELSGVERQAHAEAARGIRAGLVLERGAMRRKAAAQELVRVERAPG